MSAALAVVEDEASPVGRFWPNAATLHEIAGEWRAVAVLVPAGDNNEWSWHVSAVERALLPKLVRQGVYATVHARGSDGRMRMLAARVPAKHVRKFNADAAR